ncbi:MAG: hypothetical protein A2722_00375 [Candidatus Doudnabacteria bacterium RIFCSPHIGHO2_01_FULL_50_11]|uniref:Vitamin K epoxide reductase domain-containing protein n=1 Tax=Candidatus Doudnabacteria bacterium RIFCSPHIGHO2_01_FULL_50_11 TaxID=1817828 RepID=A0A1F5PGX7_9BACT|nr:MAG: hypothetical protein A2722_00375 [Candidatus Doudnabacteria bacterium RIFCSPHIGHO2_01_FULL_50_11]HLC44734.1 vitamin K epoxide reductase family protein [Patescibacteria group bacterium]
MDGRNRKIFITAAIFSLIGILDAGYLTYERYFGTGLKCFAATACNVVTTSKYSEVAGVPISLFGLGYYLLMFISILWMSDRNDYRLLFPARILSSMAFVSSLGLVYIQFFILKALCPYCLLSAATSTVIFVCLVLARKIGKTNNSPSP